MSLKYISLIAKSITETATVSILIDDEIVLSTVELNSKFESALCTFKVNATWAGVKRISVTATKGSITLMNTEIMLNDSILYSTVIKDNVCIDNQPVITTRINEDGAGEWHYDINEHSTLTFDLVIK